MGNRKGKGLKILRQDFFRGSKKRVLTGYYSLIQRWIGLFFEEKFMKRVSNCHDRISITQSIIKFLKKKRKM